MTDERPLRGPDFLPYPLPAPPVVHEPTPPAAQPADDAVPPAVVAAVVAGTAALLSLLLVTWLGGHEGAGAALAVLAAGVAVLAGRAALRTALPQDRRTATQAAQATGVLAALVALLVLAVGGGSASQAQPPVRVPSPAPTGAPTADPAPQPTTPDETAPPGAVNGFGIPSQPGPPLSASPTDTGTLLGHVVSTAGLPVEGATVTVTRATAGDTSSTPECPLRITTRTDEQGLYRLKLCQLGDNLGYTVTITVGTATARSDLFVNAGQTTVYDVILPVRR